MITILNRRLLLQLNIPFTLLNQSEHKTKEDTWKSLIGSHYKASLALICFLSTSLTGALSCLFSLSVPLECAFSWFIFLPHISSHLAPLCCAVPLISIASVSLDQGLQAQALLQAPVELSESDSMYTAFFLTPSNLENYCNV